MPRTRPEYRWRAGDEHQCHRFRTNSLGNFSVDAATASATNVLLENGGRLDVLGNGSADTTTVNQGGILAVSPAVRRRTS